MQYCEIVTPKTADELQRRALVAGMRRMHTMSKGSESSGPSGGRGRRKIAEVGHPTWDHSGCKVTALTNLGVLEIASHAGGVAVFTLLSLLRPGMHSDASGALTAMNLARGQQGVSLIIIATRPMPVP